MSAIAPRYREAHVGGCLSAEVTQRADGSVLLRSTEALGAYPVRLTDHLERWAREAPERTFAARRAGGNGEWQRVTYAQMLDRARRIGQFLVDRKLSAERPLLILSGNDLDHLSLAFGALWAGVPYLVVSTAYSLVSKDFGKLRQIAAKTTPGMVFASGAEYAPAIADAIAVDVPVVVGTGVASSSGSSSTELASALATAVPTARPTALPTALSTDSPGRETIAFADLLHTDPGASLDTAHAAVTADTIAKFLFTSGSTKAPKGVITTHRMWCANLQMIRQTLAFLGDEPPVLVDWLPWNHVFGGSHNIGITLSNGGTLYIDDGKPTPSGIAETLRNLREISPTIYFNVPKGIEEIVAAMDHDEALREKLFARCRAFMFAGAALSQVVWNKLHAHAEATVGERVRVITGLGMTETAPSCTFAVGTDVAAGHIGLPVPGVEIKLVQDTASATGSSGTADKTEIRFRGPNVMPGYWREPEQTAEAFDDEGFYRTGDAVKWIDEADPQRGLFFDGRTAEDFKLSSGTFVSVGPLRARIVLAGDPCVQDAVITGLNRSEVGALIFPRVDDCRRLAGAPPTMSLAEVVRQPALVDFFRRLADRLWHEGSGSASRIARLLVLTEPPSIDRGEVTDKGSINQRAVLAHRAALVDAVHEGSAAGLVRPNVAPVNGAGTTTKTPGTPGDSA